MDIAGETSKEGGMESGSIYQIMGISTAIVMFFTFLRLAHFRTGTYDPAGDEVKESDLASASKDVECYDGVDLMV